MDKKKIVTCAIVGCGDRANLYARSALKSHDDLRIVAAVDPDRGRRERAAAEYGFPPERCFASVEEFARLGRIADCVINGTMDAQHYETALPLLKLGYHTLLEKPVTNNARELFELVEAAKENGCKLVICHVLRYSAFYRTVKEIVLSGEIGEIVHLETNENVGVAHASNSYIRGKWSREDVCGSSMMLAKCCHDLDLICWLNNASAPRSVFSFGGRDFLNEAHAPEGAGTRCLKDCPLVDTCQYSAKTIYLDNDLFPQYPWESTGKDYRTLTREEKYRSLAEDNPHGACAYRTGANVVDHQVLAVRFANGSTAVHTLVCGAPKPSRKIHIVGTHGEIQGVTADLKLFVRKFRARDASYDERTIDFSDAYSEGDGHLGGDSVMVDDFIRLLQGETPSVSYSGIEDSVHGHLCVFFGDQSMREGVRKDIIA